MVFKLLFLLSEFFFNWLQKSDILRSLLVFSEIWSLFFLNRMITLFSVFLWSWPKMFCSVFCSCFSNKLCGSIWRGCIKICHVCWQSYHRVLVDYTNFFSVARRQYSAENTRHKSRSGIMRRYFIINLSRQHRTKTKI